MLSKTVKVTNPGIFKGPKKANVMARAKKPSAMALLKTRVFP